MHHMAKWHSFWKTHNKTSVGVYLAGTEKLITERHVQEQSRVNGNLPPKVGVASYIIWQSTICFEKNTQQNGSEGLYRCWATYYSEACTRVTRELDLTY
jgi:hypothetical protein